MPISNGNGRASNHAVAVFPRYLFEMLGEKKVNDGMAPGLAGHFYL